VKLFTSDKCHDFDQYFGRRWAWWSALIYLSVIILSATTTFQTTTPADLFAGLHLAQTEREIVRDVPLQSYHLLLPFVPPLLFTLALLLAWRRDFGLSVDKKADKRQVEPDFT